VTGGIHRQIRVTRRVGESYLPDCVVDRYQRPPGWMFWRSFIGGRKGPCFIWDRKAMGTISATTYIRYALPKVKDIWDELRALYGPDIQFMQDNAPSHCTAVTKTALVEWQINTVDWPAYSPDLSPIETVWSCMKLYIIRKYPERMPKAQLRDAIQDAWDSIKEEDLIKLIKSMRDRCEAVIAANGGPTPY